jgi:transposase
VRIETRHTKAFLKAQVNKTDKSDARGIAQMIRVNLFRPVHVKTLASQQRRALLTGRKLLQEKAIAIENDIRGLVRNFGLKVGAVGVIKFENRIRELIDGMPDLADITDALLIARRKIREQYAKLHRKLLAIVRYEVCTRLMTIPGVGPVCRWHFPPPSIFRHFHQLKSSRARSGVDADPQSIWRKQPRRPDITLRRQYDANATL